MSCTNCGAVQDATNRIQKDKRAHELKKLIIVCMAVVLVVLCICGTVLGCYTIKTQQETILEQQYALNMQYVYDPGKAARDVIEKFNRRVGE